jgi:hypothetical protein
LLKAAAVGVSDSVAANAFSPILMVICCAMDFRFGSRALPVGTALW